MSKEKVITPAFTVSFPNVFRPSTFNNKEEYNLTMLWDKSEDLGKLKQLVKEAAEEKWGKLPKNLQSPFKKGETKDEEKYPNFQDKVFANAKSQFQPGLVDQSRNPIIDENEFYAGCVARASVTAYAWEYMGKKGVSFNLNNVQKVADGERIGGSRDAADDFDDIEVENVDLGKDDFGIDDL